MLWALGLFAVADVQVSLPPRPDCPTADAVAQDIETLIGVSPPPPVEVRIELRETAEGLVATVTYTAGSHAQTRTIPGASCADVVNAAAVVVAVGVDPIAVQRTLQPVLQRPTREPEPVDEIEPPPALPIATEQTLEAQPEPASPVDASPAQQSSPRAPAPRRRRPSLGVFARGGVGVGTLPNPSGWVGGGVQVGLGGLRVELSAHHLFAQVLEHPDDASTGAEVSVTAARPAACWTPRVGPFTLGGCAGLDVGVMRGQGFGLENRGTATPLWLAATPGLRAHWHPSRRFSLGLSVDVPISLARPALTIDDFDAPLVQAGQAGAWVGLSVQFTFFDETPARRR